MKEVIFMSHNCHEIDAKEIREATTDLRLQLRLAGGRGMQFDLSKLIECYITNLALRDELNEVIKEESYTIL